MNSLKPALSVVLVKRSFDVLTGLLGTAAFVASYPLLALLIRLESKGPVVYRQERVGINRRGFFASARDASKRSGDVGGKPFTILKYRTMRVDAESLGPQLAQKGVDPRVTRLGRRLRALHLDELPQFWNILKGEMSFIGPRPERPHFTRQYAQSIPHYLDRTLGVKPGLTGLAQIILGYDDSLQSVIRKVHYDYSYRASLSSLSSYLRLESWILVNTLLYLFARPKSETSNRELPGLKRARLLPFRAGLPQKAEAGGSPSDVRLHHLPNKSLIMVGKSPSELSRRLSEIDFTGKKSVEVRLDPHPHFDLEDLGFLVRLVNRVKKTGGRVVVRNEDPRIGRMLKAIHLDKVVSLERGQKPVRNFLTIDVECWFHAYNLKERVTPSTWHLQPTRIVDNVRRILDLLKTHDAKATFFVLGWVADHFPEVVRMIDEGGHEIGTHGYHHMLITDMTPTLFEADLAKSLEALGKCTSQRIIGHRASNFTVVESTLWALEILAKYGIEYDSSIFPIRRSRYGIPDYPNRLPHMIQLESGKSIAEVPLSTLGVGKKLMPISGGGYLRLYPYRVTDRYIEQKNMQGLPAMVYFHPWELDTDQEKLDVGLLQSFQHYVNLDTTEWKIARLLERFDFGTVRDTLGTRRIQNLLRRNPVKLVTVQEAALREAARAGAPAPRFELLSA